MVEKQIISTPRAPLPKGPYSQAVVAGDLVFVAGQGPLDPKTGQFVLGEIRDECELTLKNIQAILRACGADLNNVVQCTVYLANLVDFEAMNEVYSRFFPRQCPARTTTQAGRLLAGIKIEIDAVAFVDRRAATQRRTRRRGRASRT